MKKLNISEFEKKLAALPEVEPDEWDLKMLKEIESEKDKSTVSIEDVTALRETTGRISLRVPKTLHAELIDKAKAEGVSLNQYALYKLAK